MFIDYSSSESRDDALSKIIKMQQALRNSEIWEIGTKFETTFGDFMTINQVVDFFEVNGGRDTINCYTRTERNGKVNSTKEELESMGARRYSNAELKSMKENFLKQNLVLNNDATTKNMKFNSQGITLFPLSAVCKLGMFMTGTSKAVEFRDKIIETLIKHQKRIEVDKTLSDTYFKSFETRRVYISLTEALDLFYKNNPKYNKISTQNVYRILSTGVRKKGDTTRLGGYCLLTPVTEESKNRRVTEHFSFLRNAIKLVENKGSFSGQVNKLGYAYLDIMLKIFYGEIIFSENKNSAEYHLNPAVESGKYMRKFLSENKHNPDKVKNVFTDIIYLNLENYENL